MASSLATTFLWLSGLAWLPTLNHAFYLEGVNPQSFGEGDVVELKVDKITSTKTLLPLDYYKLPFCAPMGGPRMDNQNLGMFLAGDRIESSPYLLRMKEESYCQQLCISNLGRSETPGRQPNKVVKAIRQGYHNNWIVDNMSAASKVEDDSTITTRYWEGFPIGYVAEDSHLAYIYNHVNIEIMYHPVEDEVNKYRVVRFTVQPFSIAHDFTPVDEKEEDIAATDDDAPRTLEWAVIKNPIASCNPNVPKEQRRHTNYAMVTDIGRHPQLASGKVLFTYDVHWEENLFLDWSSRWDIYLSMDNAIPAKVHWLGIASSLVIVSVLSATILAILIRNLRQDLAQYNRVATDVEKSDDLQEKGWKSVHADVFRPPSFSPLLLSVACGTGAQLLCTTFLTILFSTLGFLNPSRRGVLVMAELLFYALMGVVSGYVTARLYKTFEGEKWQNATLCTALGFPGICFIFFLLIDLMAWSYGSSLAVPFITMFILLFLWLGIATPFVFLGAYFGYKQDAIEFPMETSNTPRPIPDQRWFRSVAFTLMIGGILPFVLCFVELYFILASVWMGYYFYGLGYLLVVFVMLMIICAEMALLFNYCQLCNEDYRWWWRSFGTGGSSAIYVFLYSLVYFQELEAQFSVFTYVLYFGVMGLASLGWFLMTGCIGVFSSLWFNKTIFVSLKSEME